MAVPTVTAVTPTSGSALGTNTVVLTGTALTGATAVLFGTTSIATGYTVDSALQITVTSVPAHNAGLINVTVTTAEGTSATATANQYTYTATLFTEAEARAFNNDKLADTVKYPLSDIAAAEARIRAQFTDICGVYFVPTTTSEYLDGDGSDTIYVSEFDVASVTACITYATDLTVSETFDATDLLDLAIYPHTGRIVRRQQGTFPVGQNNVYITYVHGYTTVPADIKRAALMVLLTELTYTSVGDRTTSFSDGNMTFQLATAGRTNQWYGLPLVDSVLARHRRELPGVA